MTKTELIGEILYRGDGPVTEFVAISRAVELALDGSGSKENIANALSESLDDIRDNGGELPSSEYPEEYGS